MRRPRPWLVTLLALLLGMSQVLAAAHACSLGGAIPLDNLAASALAVAMPADCPEAEDSPVPQGNVCETHCLAADQSSQGVSPVMAFASHPPLVVDVPAPLQAQSAATFQVSPYGGAPPPELRFARLLN
jgi:hypothetical protein